MSVVQPELRPLTDRERGLLEKLLEPAFPGRDQLRLQLTSVVAEQVLDDGTLKLHCDPSAPASAARGLATEGRCKDADGEDIDVMLHVSKSGFMWLLEILKCAPSPIINPPTPHNLVR
jgi:hypothetical protein